MENKFNLTKSGATKLFFISYAIFMVATVLQTTMYSYNTTTERIFEIMRYCSFVLVAAKVLIDLWFELKESKGSPSLRKQWWLRIGKYAAMSALVAAVSYTADERSLIFLLVFLIGARTEDINKIFQFTIYLQIFMMCYIILSAETGIIKDLMFERDGVYTRHSLGYWFPSYIMSYYFFTLLLKFWIAKTPVPLRDIFIYEAINVLFYILTDARLGLVINTVLIFCEFLHSTQVINRGITGFVGKVKSHRKLSKVLAVIFDGTPVWICIATFFLCRFPYSYITARLNYLLSNRLVYILNGFFGFGIHILGNPIEWIGYGGRTNMFSISDSYNFVDSSYPFILYQYGILIFLAVLWVGVNTAVKIRRSGDWYRYVLYVLIFLYCFVEPRLIELNMNTLMFLSVPFICRVPKFKKSEKTEINLTVSQ